MTDCAAVIDLGTNSVKLLVARRAGDSFETLAERSVVVRLGDGLAKDGLISDAAAGRTLEALVRLVDEARTRGAETVQIIATQAMRIAENSQWFAKLVESKTGVRMRVIGGDEEARLSFAAVSVYAAADQPVLMFDAGGGSTEFVYGAPRQELLRVSAPVGALTLFDLFASDEGCFSPDSLAAARRFIDETLQNAGFETIRRGAADAPHRLIGVGGTVTTLASVALGLPRYDRSKVEGLPLGRGTIEKQLALLDALPLAERKQIAGLPEDRAEIAPAGALLIEQILRLTGREVFTASARGLRHGVMTEFFAKQ